MKVLGRIVGISMWALAFMALQLPCHALSMNSDAEYTVTVEGAGGGDTIYSDSDPDSASSGYVYSYVQYGTGDNLLPSVSSGGGSYGTIGTASASGSESGSLAASTWYFDYSGGGMYDFDANVTWEDTIANTSSSASAFDFTFLINDVSLGIWDYAGVPDTDPDAMTAFYEIVISTDVGGVLWESGAVLRGGQAGESFTQSGTALSYTRTQSGGEIAYDFGDVTDTVDLGILGVGESLALTYELRVGVSGPGYETGAWARAGDPFDSGPIVPEPASLALMGLGLSGLALMRCRFRG